MIFQGDFGKGVFTGSGIYEPGTSPWTLYGPIAAGATTVMTNAVPQIPFRLGTVVPGDMETEWVFCRWVPGSTTDLKPGNVFTIDENYTATLALTSGIVLNTQVGVCCTLQAGVVAGTYYLWLARAGRLGVRAAASSIATGMAETTATAGVVKFLLTHTGGSATIAPMPAWAASSNITFTGNTVSGAPYINVLASQISINGQTGGITDLLPGMTITGTGMPSNALIAFIDQKGSGGAYRIGIGTDTTGNLFTSQNATSTATGTTFTVTSHVQALVYWPTETVQN